MFISLASCLLALVPLAFIPSTHAATHNVTVGGPGVLAYNPEFVNAAVGDTIVFEFHQKNHTATQSTLAAPCTKLNGGFDSGFVPVADNNTAGPFPVAHYQVTSTKPVWVFCAQANHCQTGMVFAVNPGNNFTQFKSNAQNSNPGGTAAPGSSPPGSTNHVVTVGANNGLIYDPSEVTANPGDTVTFQFSSKNHTVTQSSFATPCQPLASTNTSGQAGFDSGFMPVTAGSGNVSFTITVNDTTPIWVYCRQANHCGQGMVFAVNAVDSGPKNFTAFKANAQQQNGTSGTSSASQSGAPRSVAGSGFALSVVAVVVTWVLCC